MNQDLPAAQLFNGKNQPRHAATVANAYPADGIQIAHETALVDGDAAEQSGSQEFPWHKRQQIVSVFINSDNRAAFRPSTGTWLHQEIPFPP
jgi:hypothetical protein